MSRSPETPEQIEAVARTIDPGCKREGNNWVMADPISNSGKKHSLSMHCTKGTWADFSGTAKGSSAAALLAHYKAFLPAKATQLLSKPSTAPVVAPAAAIKASPSWPAAPTNNIPTFDSPHGFKHTATWAYKDPQGRNVMLVARFDGPEGKTIRPSRWNDGWEPGDPAGPLPLFNLDQMAARPNAPLLVVEGERSAEAAQAIFPDHVCTTSAHGAASAARSDWSAVKGRHITVWPDNDAPGRAYAQEVAQLAYAAGALSVRIVEIPSHFPPKHDLADRKPEGADYNSMLKDAVLVPRPPKPIEMLDPSSWLDNDPPPIRWLQRGLLPHGVPAILAGKSNCGKSLAAMQMSMAVAVGQSLFGLETEGVAHKVLYLSMEDDADELHRRFRRCLDLLRKSMLWTPHLEARLLANWRAVVPVWASKDLKTLVALTGHLQDFSAQLCETGEKLGLIVLDTLAALADGEENAAEVQQSFWAACHQLVESTGATPLVLHHVRKSMAQKPPSMIDRLNFENLRGSSAIVAGARAILQMEPITPAEARKLDLDEDRAIAGNYVVLSLTKINGSSKGVWIALAQRSSVDVGAGFFDLMEDSERICAGLRSRAAAAALSQAEGILLDLSNKVSREEIARKHWPEDKDQARKLAKAISGLRTKQRWLEKGSEVPTMKGQMLLAKLRRQCRQSADTEETESEQ